MKCLPLLLVCFLLLVAQQSFAQREKGTQLLDKLLSEEKFEEAQKELQSQIEKYQSQGRYDSLSGYPYYVGKIALQNFNKQTAINQVERFADNFEKETNNPIYLQDLYGELGAFYQYLGMHDEEIKNHLKALENALSIEGKPGSRIGKGYYNVGTGELHRGNISDAIENYRKALTFYSSDPASVPEDFYYSYSAMGTSMYYSSKIDSAIYFYEKSVNYISKSENSPINQYYRPALVLNNIAGLHSLQGKSQQSLDAMKRCIAYNQKFITSKAPEIKKADAKRSHYLYIDNLAGIYEKLGDYNKNLNLLSYSYKKKKEHLAADSPDVFKSEILLGNAYLHLLDLDESETFFKKGIGFIDRLPGNFFDWYASAHYGLARVYQEQEKFAEAKKYFEDAYTYFTLSSATYYDPNFLTFFEDASQFYAMYGDNEKALEYANNAYQYVSKHQGDNTLPAFQQTLNLAGVYLQIGQTEKALEYSTSALQKFQNKNFQAENLLDSIQVEFYKPEAILIETKSKYLLTTEKSEAFLKSLLSEIEEALTILNRRKQFVSSYENIQALIEENNKLYDFAKQLNVALYQKTTNETYLDNLITLHETALYNRIRSRLNAQNQLNVANVPEHILETEKRLKEAVTTSLSENGIDAYMDAVVAWESFLNSLQKDYPKYHQLRYGTTEVSIEEIVANIPENTSVIRYIFVDNSLYAMFLNNSEKILVPLQSENLNSAISAINQPTFSVEAMSAHLTYLYDTLWKPFEKNLRTQRIIIVPDGILYNLSFDMLTASQINTMEAFASESLLSKHTISYNISLLLLQNNSETFNNTYIAFAPEFSTEMKDTYVSQTKDSLTFDTNYLMLLPQPFSVDLVKKYASVFNGRAFTSFDASKEKFTTSSKNHNILHIGTHAESNNISPELSRLIFAKTNEDTSTEDNYLYAYEIYNHDLSSSLAILTACETGKPSYKAGEGMISLAHAFTYAGSQSILTSLWKIDEKSSNEIVGFFYDNLNEGMPKDEALRQAKLSYLSTAQGRTLAPQYWAGLVLMGDTTPLALNASSTPWALYIIGGVLLLGILFFFFKKS